MCNCKGCLISKDPNQGYQPCHDFAPQPPQPPRQPRPRFLRDGGPLVHNPMWEIIINSVLRFTQCRFTSKPWLVVTKYNNSNYEHITGYGFIRVQMRYTNDQ